MRKVPLLLIKQFGFEIMSGTGEDSGSGSKIRGINLRHCVDVLSDYLEQGLCIRQGEHRHYTAICRYLAGT